MQKTKLGISVGLLGAAIYFTGLFSGYLVAVILAGYVLLCEDNEWLRKSAVKAVALMVFFSLLTILVNLIPDIIGCLDNLFGMFGGKFSINVLTCIVNMVVSALDIIKKILFVGLGIKALDQGTIAFPVVDRLINKYMG